MKASFESWLRTKNKKRRKDNKTGKKRRCLLNARQVINNIEDKKMSI
jgi:hypothetical protein